MTEVKQCLHLKLSVSSVSYLYTHLNYVESGLGRFVMGNLIWPSRANLRKWGRDLIGSGAADKGVWMDSAALTDSWAIVMEKAYHFCLSEPSHPSPLLDPLLNTILTPTSFLSHSPQIPSYQPIHLTPPHLLSFCPSVILFMVRLQSWLHQCHCSISFSLYLNV